MENMREMMVWLSNKNNIEYEEIGNYSIYASLVNNRTMFLSLKNNMTGKVFESNVDLSTIKSTKNIEKDKNLKLKQYNIKPGRMIYENKCNLSFFNNNDKYSLIRNILLDIMPNNNAFLFSDNGMCETDISSEYYNTEFPDNLYNFNIKESKNNLVITFMYSYIYFFTVEKNNKTDNIFSHNYYASLETVITEKFTITLIKTNDTKVDKFKKIKNNNYFVNDFDLSNYV